MDQTIRPATPADIPRMVELLLLDARERHAADAILWRMTEDAAAQIERALTFALTADAQSFPQFWYVAQGQGPITGVIHAMLLPVPPIYAGSQGEPGLILPDTFVSSDAPDGTLDALLTTVQKVLREAGAQIILSSYVTGATWQHALDKQGFEPLTLYLSRSGLERQVTSPNVRFATEADIAGIVERSAENRHILYGIDPFWEIHPEADPRFTAWMTRSLTLRDRDMFVIGAPDCVEGYAIAQPASRLHFPPAHDISKTGVIDDFFHAEMAKPETLANGGAGALIGTAENALAIRGVEAAFVVCPAGWPSKIEMLKAAGYKTAMVWFIKR